MASYLPSLQRRTCCCWRLCEAARCRLVFSRGGFQCIRAPSGQGCYASCLVVSSRLSIVLAKKHRCQCAAPRPVSQRVCVHLKRGQGFDGFTLTSYLSFLPTRGPLSFCHRFASSNMTADWVKSATDAKSKKVDKATGDVRL